MRNWTLALSVYRASVDLYRQAVEIRLPRATSGGVPAAEVVPSNPSTSFDSGLSTREREVAGLIARGFTNQQIAEELVVTRGTVANHVAHILTKLALSNRTQVATYLVGGLVDAPGPDAWSRHPVRKVS